MQDQGSFSFGACYSAIGESAGVQGIEVVTRVAWTSADAARRAAFGVNFDVLPCFPLTYRSRSIESPTDASTGG